MTEFVQEIREQLAEAQTYGELPPGSGVWKGRSPSRHGTTGSFTVQC